MGPTNRYISDEWSRILFPIFLSTLCIVTLYYYVRLGRTSKTRFSSSRNVSRKNICLLSRYFIQKSCLVLWKTYGIGLFTIKDVRIDWDIEFPDESRFQTYLRSPSSVLIWKSKPLAGYELRSSRSKLSIVTSTVEALRHAAVGNWRPTRRFVPTIITNKFQPFSFGTRWHRV